MADIALGSVEKIVNIALKIKEAVETVKQNEKECRDIQRFVGRVSALIRRLDETTEMMRDEVMRNALEDLAETLERALVLVTECQRKHFFRRFIGAGDMAKELRQLQDEIMRQMQLGNFATGVQTTVVVTDIQSAGVHQPSPPPAERVIIDAVASTGFIQFSLSELKAATEDFSDKNIIGRGGSAVVFKGILHNGQVVAVKEFIDTFRVESRLCDAINIFLKLKHENIIRPLGYCHEVKMCLANYKGKYVLAKDERCCFVEEHMPNGNMADLITGSSRVIDWCSRFKIIQGIAEGLCYLHEQRVVHLDVKPSNILLDSHMNPRIGDFGVARMLDIGNDETTRDDENTHDDTYIFGTLVHMAPEQFRYGIYSKKGDVYAFGVTLLEIINSLSSQTGAGAINAMRWALKAREAGRMEELFNPSLCDKSQLMQIKRCIEVGLLCIQDDRKDRPTMADVLEMLNGEEELPALKLPALLLPPPPDETRSPPLVWKWMAQIYRYSNR